MAEIAIDVRGINRTQRQLFGFSQKLGGRLTLLSLRSGANLMLKQARRNAPERTGRLRRSIVVKNSRINTIRKNRTAGVYITVKKGKSRKDTKGAFYRHMVESGTVNYPGRFYIKRAFSSRKNSSAKLIIRNIEQGGKRLAQQLK